MRKTDLIFTVVFSTGEKLETTWNHPFWIIENYDAQKRGPPALSASLIYGMSPSSRNIPKGKWIEAKDLKPGQKALTKSGTAVTVTDVRQERRFETVYIRSLRQPKAEETEVCKATRRVEGGAVQENHTYYVGQDGVLVHNESEIYRKSKGDFKNQLEKKKGFALTEYEKAYFTELFGKEFNNVNIEYLTKEDASSKDLLGRAIDDKNVKLYNLHEKLEVEIKRENSLRKREGKPPLEEGSKEMEDAKFMIRMKVIGHEVFHTLDNKNSGMEKAVMHCMEKCNIPGYAKSVEIFKMKQALDKGDMKMYNEIKSKLNAVDKNLYGTANNLMFEDRLLSQELKKDFMNLSLKDMIKMKGQYEFKSKVIGYEEKARYFEDKLRLELLNRVKNDK